MTTRAISTVVDVSVCLLLVSAAVLAVVTTPVAGPDPAAGRAEELATTLAGSTAAVDYTTPGRNRTARGTYAGLLADAARMERSNRSRAFRGAVRETTTPVLQGDGWRAQVVVVWRPYEGADAGEVVVGPSPPPAADVHATSTTVPSGLRAGGRAAETAAATEGYSGVAAVLAAALVPGVGATSRERYRHTTAVALQRQFDTPTAAARALSLESARLTVRTWSP